MTSTHYLKNETTVSRKINIHTIILDSHNKHHQQHQHIKISLLFENLFWFMIMTALIYYDIELTNVWTITKQQKKEDSESGKKNYQSIFIFGNMQIHCCNNFHDWVPNGNE